jgi:hypothetical protein
MINRIKKIIAMYSTLPRKVKLLNVWLDEVVAESKRHNDRLDAVEEMAQQHLLWHAESSRPVDEDEYSEVVKVGPASFVWKGGKNEA